MAIKVASILHGAYGDYFEQIVSLKYLKNKNPDWNLHLYFASKVRYDSFKVLDLSFADKVGMWTDLVDDNVDRFYQFQVRDQELQDDVIANLPTGISDKIDLNIINLPWQYIKFLLPLSPQNQVGLSPYGVEHMKMVLRDNAIDERIFQKPVIGFLWRYRRPGGAISPFGQPTVEIAKKRVENAFNRLINEFGCHVLVCGMKVKMKGNDRERLDNKYPEFGLDLPEENCTHLKGLNYFLEAQIISRCNASLMHASGFSETVYILNPRNVFVLDPPLTYQLRLIKHRMPLFNHNKPQEFIRQWLRPHSERRIYAWLKRALAKQ